MEPLDVNLQPTAPALSHGDLRHIDKAFATFEVKGAPLLESLTAIADR